MNRFGRHVSGLALSVGLVATASGPAAGQDIEVPILVIEEADIGDAADAEDDLDLANLVTSAAKSVTTVQEAPAIITIIPAEELLDRQARVLTDVIDLVPGFLRFNAFYGTFPQAMARGTVQAVLSLRDGFSFFDPSFNAMVVHRGVPLETIKRIETISGPGGVLWGANSYLGVMNIITKDAEDIDGVEANLALADGRGDRSAGRFYVLAGLTEFLGKDDWGLVLHVAGESYLGPVYNRPGHMFSTPLPNPNSWYYYGGYRDSDPKRSTIFNFDGKLTMGKLTVQWSTPWMERYQPSGFNGPGVYSDLAEDNNPDCSRVDVDDPVVGDLSDDCLDRGGAARNDITNWYERYALADYKTRLSDTAGISVKTYFIQFVHEFKPVLVLTPVPGILEGGLSFNANPTTYRTGASLDGDVELSSKVRLLYGFEAIHEWQPDTSTNSRQGAGIEARFLAPYDLNRVPFACPRNAEWDMMSQEPRNIEYVDDCPVLFSFEVNRTTFGGFTAAQYRPSSRLIFDGGVRLQVAPEVTSLSRTHDLQPTFAAAAVYEFVPDWHVKLNYAEGFRPPVFNATDSNGEAVQLGGTPDLKIETSRSIQGEINARLLKGKKRIRELDLRIDYSYTTLENFIQFVAGRNANTGDRGIHSAEFLAKLYLKGGHRFELGYTYNRIDMADKGAFHSVPNNWFNVSSVNQLIPERLELATVLRVYGAFEDPNRRVEARDLVFDPLTGGSFPDLVDPMAPKQVAQVFADEQVMDRQPPSAELQIGVRWNAIADKLLVQATLYNAFAVERPAYDQSNDLEPRLEITPSKFEGFRAFVSATYSF